MRQTNNATRKDGAAVNFPADISAYSPQARQRQMLGAQVVTARHPQRGTLFAVVDPAAHHVEGHIAERRFSAWMSPFRRVEDAEAALVAAGGTIPTGRGR